MDVVLVCRHTMSDLSYTGVGDTGIPPLFPFGLRQVVWTFDVSMIKSGTDVLYVRLKMGIGWLLIVVMGIYGAF